MFNDFTYDLGRQVLNATSLRQQTTAHNIANLNTANFKSKQVEFESELRQLIGNEKQVQLTATHPAHFGVSKTQSTLEPKVVESNRNTMMNLDGNNVDIDLEMANMTANQLQYNTLVRQINSRLSNYSQVIRGN